MADANADESINKSDKSHELGDKERAEKPTNKEKSTSKEATVKSTFSNLQTILKNRIQIHFLHINNRHT